MGREVRRVPANWEHPKDERGNFIPLFSSFTYNEAEIREGLRDGWLKNEPPNYGCDVMPQWPDRKELTTRCTRPARKEHRSRP